MRPRLRPPGPDYEYPAWAHNALGGLPAAINPGIFLGAKTIAATLLDLLTDPALLQQAQDEFRERTGGGVGGTKWVASLLPKDFKPPIDLRWPEYIQTARGEEWWIPTGDRLRRRRAALTSRGCCSRKRIPTTLTIECTPGAYNLFGPRAGEHRLGHGAHRPRRRCLWKRIPDDADEVECRRPRRRQNRERRAWPLIGSRSNQGKWAAAPAFAGSGSPSG